MARKDEETVTKAQAEAAAGPKPGTYYRHYKGGEYIIVCCSVKEDTLQPLVTYKSLDNGHVWTRTIANFRERVDGETPRFTEIHYAGQM